MIKNPIVWELAAVGDLDDPEVSPSESPPPETSDADTKEINPIPRVTQRNNSATPIPLSDWKDMIQIDSGEVVTISGGVASGKTTLLKRIIYESVRKQQFKKYFCFVGTRDAVDSYDWLPKKYVSAVFSEGWVLQLIKVQKILKKRGIQRHVCLIFDDCLGDINFHQSRLWQKLGSSCRHFNITIILCIQLLKGISTTLRQNARHLFLGVSSGSSIQAAYEMGTISAEMTQAKFSKLIVDNVNKSQDYRIARVLLRGKGEPLQIFSVQPAPRFRFKQTDRVI